VREYELTGEQKAIIDSVGLGRTAKVIAVAGSGKTTTLREVALAFPDLTFLYLVYNKAAAEDARKSFPSNVTVKTTAALAFGAYRAMYEHRILGPRVPARRTAELLKLNRPLDLGDGILFRPTSIAAMATEAVDKFCYTSDFEVSERHVILPLGLNAVQEDALRKEIVYWARRLWNEAKLETSEHRYTFDYAFKMYVHDETALYYDVIMLDEAQDSNEIVEYFIKQQQVQQIIVGDPAQQLYQWRGSVNIMERFDGEELTLSQSWRFGEAIAEEADKWLAHTGTRTKVTGNSNMNSRVSDVPFDAPSAILCRTNGGVMGTSIEMRERGLRVAVAGGATQIISFAYAAGKLMQGKQVTDRELMAFKDWSEVVAFAEEPGGKDLKPLVNLIKMHGVGGVIDMCNGLVDERRGKPDIVLSTAHKSKGREWPVVQIGDDFSPPPGVKDPFTGEFGPGPVLKADAMLAYVAVTRGRQALGRGSLKWIDDYSETVLDPW
jgi:hypothetical protein